MKSIIMSLKTPTIRGYSPVNTVRCMVCSRPLTDPRSIALGAGPVCRLRGVSRAIGSFLGNLSKDPISPEERLGRIGFSAADIHKADINEVNISLNDLSKAYLAARELYPSIVSHPVHTSHEAVTQVMMAKEFNKAAYLLEGLQSLSHTMNAFCRLDEKHLSANFWDKVDVSVNNFLKSSGFHSHISDRQDKMKSGPDLNGDLFNAQSNEPARCI